MLLLEPRRSQCCDAAMQGVRGIDVVPAFLLCDSFSVFLDIFKRPEDASFLSVCLVGGMNLSLQPAEPATVDAINLRTSSLQAAVVSDVPLLRDSIN